MEKETKLLYKIKLELEIEEERMFLRVALQKAQSCALCVILDAKDDQELSESMKAFNLERLRKEHGLYARLVSRLDNATDEAEPWHKALN